jgi:tRNA-guanine family transglycosylase
MGARLDLARRTLLQKVGPILEGCSCSTCVEWSLGVVAALYQAREPLAYRLASIHNITLLSQVLKELRESVVYTAERSPMAQKQSST